MKILFICKYNAFRSRISEEYFKKINKNPSIKSTSRGLIIGGNSDSIQQKLAEKILNINITKRRPLPLTVNEMIQADLIIVAADDIPKIIFNYPPIQKKVVIWKIKDEQRKNERNIKNIILKIKKKVDKLNKKFKQK